MTVDDKALFDVIQIAIEKAFERIKALEKEIEKLKESKEPRHRVYKSGAKLAPMESNQKPHGLLPSDIEY